ncbi:MAG: hypothetical protein IJT60_05500 [Clostridia bacterium]|nr:hypothetical protein [Clostridia bacterium]
MGGRVADKVIFTATAGGETYRYCQYFCAYASMIYVLTYTSRDALFASHMLRWKRFFPKWSWGINDDLF